MTLQSLTVSVEVMVTTFIWGRVEMGVSKGKHLHRISVPCTRLRIGLPQTMEL